MSTVPDTVSPAPYGTLLSRREAGILAGFRDRLRGVPVPAGSGGMFAVL